MLTNRFFNIDGDVSTQLAPWVLKELGKPINPPLYRLEKDLLFRSDIADGILIVKSGLISDLASIPTIAYSILTPSDNRIALIAWFHDYGYKNSGVMQIKDREPIQLTRNQLDRILAFEGMPELGAEDFLCKIVYNGVNYFGQSRWGKV